MDNLGKSLIYTKNNVRYMIYFKSYNEFISEKFIRPNNFYNGNEISVNLLETTEYNNLLQKYGSGDLFVLEI